VQKQNTKVSKANIIEQLKCETERKKYAKEINLMQISQVVNGSESQLKI